MDNKLRVFFANESDTADATVDAHSDYINAIAFSATDNLLASTSDDHTTSIWDTTTNALIQSISLKSPGRSVKFHPNHPGLVMVAEQSGRVTVYDLRGDGVHTKTVSIPLDEGGLAEADWNPKDSSQIGAVTARQWHIWSLDHSTVATAAVHHGPPMNLLTHFRWNPTNGNVFAINGKVNQVNIVDQTQGIPYRVPPAPTRVGNISWSSDSSCIIYGSNKYLHWHATS